MEVLVVGVVLAGALSGILVFRRSVQPRNLLFITLDTTRADRIGCYGDASAETPTLDSLARRGVLFERAYAPAPITAPSHVSMFTGLFPPEHGVWTNGGVGLSADVPVLAEMLQSRGFATAAFISSVVLEPKCGLDRGFDVYDFDLPVAGTAINGHGRSRDGKQAVDAALKWLTARPARQKPFFCWVHLFDPHDPYLPHRDEFGDNSQTARMTQRSPTWTCNWVGYSPLSKSRAFWTRRSSSSWAITAKAWGTWRTQHGYMLHESTLRVPLIIADPREKSPGRRISTPVSLVDLFPTLLTLGGVAPTGSAERELQPALRGQPLRRVPAIRKRWNRIRRRVGRRCGR